MEKVDYKKRIEEELSPMISRVAAIIICQDVEIYYLKELVELKRKYNEVLEKNIALKKEEINEK